MGLMGPRVGCLRTASLTGNMRDLEVLRIVVSEVLSEDRAPIGAIARAASATRCRGQGADRRRRNQLQASSS